MTTDRIDLTDAIGSAIVATTPADDPLALVGNAAEAERVARELLHQAVASARSAGLSWAALGSELGMSRQAAQQRFSAEPGTSETAAATHRWLGPVTAFDEMAELELAGKQGWHTVGVGMFRHLMVQTDTQWEHKRVMWRGVNKRLTVAGWVVGARALPWVYLIRDTGLPAVTVGEKSATQSI